MLTMSLTFKLHFQSKDKIYIFKNSHTSINEVIYLFYFIYLWNHEIFIKKTFLFNKISLCYYLIVICILSFMFHSFQNHGKIVLNISCF